MFDDACLFLSAQDLDLSFKDWSTLPAFLGAMYYTALAIVVVAVVGTIIYYLYKLYLKLRGKHVELTPVQIKDILETAGLERSRFDLTLGKELQEGRSIPCTLISVNDAEVRLEVPRYINVQKHWIGREAYCFFRVKSSDPLIRYDFYHFNAIILTIRLAKTGDKVFHLAFPVDMAKRQRRKFFRITPPRGTFKELAAWPEIRSRMPREQLGKPSVHLDSERAGGSSLINVSAGGMLLEMDSYDMSSSSLSAQTGGEWFVRLVLYEPAKKANFHWWLLARVLKSYKNNLGKLELGFKFIAFAQDPKRGEKFDWVQIGENGVPGLDSWVFRRSVEMRQRQRERE